MRRFLKRGAELALVRSGLAGAWQRASGRDVVVLAYHNVVPSGDKPVGDSSLHLPLSRFEAQLDVLCETHDVVSLQALLAADNPGKGPVAAITFDDAYLGALELGIPALSARSLPCTVFVCPGLLGSEGFWWDRVSDTVSGAVPEGFRRWALQGAGGRQEMILERASSLGLVRDPLPDLYRPASKESVESMAGHPRVTFGSHTWSHVDLTSVPGPEATEELRRSLDWVRERFPAAAELLSYPYGAFTGELEALVREAGYKAAFLVRGGAGSLRDVRRALLAIPRLNVPRGLSLEGFLARIWGAWPR